MYNVVVSVRTALSLAFLATVFSLCCALALFSTFLMRFFSFCASLPLWSLQPFSCSFPLFRSLSSIWLACFPFSAHANKESPLSSDTTLWNRLCNNRVRVTLRYLPFSHSVHLMSFGHCTLRCTEALMKLFHFFLCRTHIWGNMKPGAKKAEENILFATLLKWLCWKLLRFKCALTVLELNWMSIKWTKC